MTSRRALITSLAAAGVGTGVSSTTLAALLGTAAPPTNAPLRGLPFVLDMVHNNPGEAPFVTKFNDTGFLKTWGYDGQIPKFFLQAAITYDAFDPALLPARSETRAWSEKAAADIDAHIAAAQAHQMPLYPFTDVLVVPKALMAKYGADMRDGDQLSILKPMTERVMRAQISEIFDRFPGLAGITIRFGETYLQDTPFHTGSTPVASVAEHQALIRLLRDEVCVKRGKVVFYRTWSFSDIQLHTHPDSYLTVTDAVEPHPNLVISIKHSSGDFLRGVPFNATLGIGKHRQIVEVSCMQAGVYGKNAHPYYIGRGVIDGWDEMGAAKKGIKSLVGSPRLAGVWTWTRGDGWAGPYITNEFWVNLNAWIISHFAEDPSKTEPELFNAYARTQLGLDDTQTTLLRDLCLRATSATYHGQQSSLFAANVWWCRDEYLTAVDLKAVIEQDIVAPVLAEKAQAVADWTYIEKLARQIRLNRSEDQTFLEVSSTYGRLKFAIIEQIWIMQILAAQADKARRPLDKTAMRSALKTYDALWIEWRKLKDTYACCPTLYTDAEAWHVGPVLKPVLDTYRGQVV
jgi:hypothetical protein